tara:strand:- start:5848 stop:6141 length:294 start_codon:yes stop_codon:yes gene_type:complete
MKDNIILTLFAEYIGTVLFLTLVLFTDNIVYISIGLCILLSLTSLFTKTHSFNPAISLLLMLTKNSNIKISLLTIFIHVLAILTVFIIYKNLNNKLN